MMFKIECGEFSQSELAGAQEGPWGEEREGGGSCQELLYQLMCAKCVWSSLESTQYPSTPHVQVL